MRNLNYLARFAPHLIAGLAIAAVACGTSDPGETGAGGQTASGGGNNVGGADVGGGGSSADGGSTSVGGGGSGPNWDCDEEHDIVIHTSYGDIEHCGEFYIPLNNDSEATSVQIFSTAMETFAFQNNSGAEMTINSGVVYPRDGVQQEEFTLREDSLQFPPIEISDESVASMDEFSFQIQFHPVAGNERLADVELKYDDGRTFGFTVKGRGHPKTDPDTAILSTNMELEWHKLFGGYGASQDEQPGGIAADANGNIFFASATKTLLNSDGFYYDLLYGRINTDGTLGWYNIWSSTAKDYLPDAGENDQSGSPKAVVVDDAGNPYVMGAVGVGNNATNVHAALIMKLDPATGEPEWETFWHPKWDRILNNSFTDSAVPYAMDFNDGRIYVTGQYSTNDDGGSLASSNSGLFVIALDASDGTLLWQKHVEPAPTNGTNDRGYAVKAVGSAGTEDVFVGGWTGETAVNNTFLAKLEEDSGDHVLAWQKTYGFHSAARINGLDVDGNGDAYISVDNADYTATFAKINGADGTIAWAKEIDDVGSGSAEVTTDAVHVDGDQVYFGGILKINPYDTQAGDAWFAKVNSSDGELDFLNFYFSGKGTQNLCSHKIKGIAIDNGTAYLGGSVYTSNMNYFRYWGYWYNGTRGLIDVDPTIVEDNQTDTAIEDIVTGSMYTFAELEALNGTPATKVINITERHYGEQITDYPNTMDDPKPIEFQDADAKNADTNGAQVDKDLMFWKLKLQ